ncbi:hypothetical protein [Hyphomicrobium sp. NDB2Meth4]|uniref:hypothetical protein n=1 Tax=Hyphomicrobium sp. NDB2Meth4 TaxID=1892846 RepID=UPI00093180AC|nr:hypothetical protein [Hyphomicrobium sp. NDB2Meth4]
MNARPSGRSPSGRSILLILVGIAVVGLAGLGAMHIVSPAATPPLIEEVHEAEMPEEHTLAPSLDCAFHDMMRTHAVVSYYFDVTVSENEAPRFYERAIVAENGTRTNFAGDDRPAWSYSLDDDGKPMITSPDGGERIVLYGLKLGTAGIWPVEAGIRSNHYRNLGGECRQTNLAAAPR